MTSGASRMRLRVPKISKFSEGACPQTPLGGPALQQLQTSWINKIFIAPPNQIFCLRPCKGWGACMIHPHWVCREFCHWGYSDYYIMCLIQCSYVATSASKYTDQVYQYFYWILTINTDKFQKYWKLGEFSTYIIYGALCKILKMYAKYWKMGIFYTER